MKKARKLFILWIIVFALFTAAILFSSTMYAMENHLPKKDLPEQAKLILDVVILVIFCPTLAFIGNMRKKRTRTILRELHECFCCFFSLLRLVT